MFKIGLPKKEKLEANLSKIDVLINEIVEHTDLSDIANKINTFYLLNYTINISVVPVSVIKYEINGTEIIKWNGLSDNTSGAQRFCIAFVLTVILMEYKRYNKSTVGNEDKYKGKVLLMDNPFGETSEEKFLDEIFELAERFNVQIVSYTHVKNDSVRSHFDKIYSMTVEQTVSEEEVVIIDELRGKRVSNANAEESKESVNFGVFRVNEEQSFDNQESFLVL